MTTTPSAPHPGEQAMTVEVTQEDRDLLEAISGGFMEWRPKAKAERLEMIARHRIEATRAAAERIAELEGALGRIETRLRPHPDDMAADYRRNNRLAHSIARTALQRKEPGA